MNKEVNAEINKIFNTFNKMFFDNKLPLPLFKFSKCQHTTINTNVVAKKNNKYSHELHLPRRCLNEPIDIFAMYVLECMIREYDFINDAKLFSRNGEYANKRFKAMAESCGLMCEDTKGKRGFVIHSNETFKNICEKGGFKKTWGKIYECNDGRKNDNSYKYKDPLTNESVRGTKKGHFIICFNECPEIGEQVEKMFGKKRMMIV